MYKKWTFSISFRLFHFKILFDYFLKQLFNTLSWKSGCLMIKTVLFLFCFEFTLFCCYSPLFDQIFFIADQTFINKIIYITAFLQSLLSLTVRSTNNRLPWNFLDPSSQKLKERFEHLCNKEAWLIWIFNHRLCPKYWVGFLIHF